MDTLDKKLRYKIELEKSVEKLKSKKGIDIDSDGTVDQTKSQKELNKYNVAYDTLIKEIAELTSKKDKFDSQLKSLQEVVKKVNEELSAAKKPYDDNECKQIAISKYNADVCVFMNDYVYYHSQYINAVLTHFKSSECKAVWCKNSLVYDKKYNRLTSQTSSTGDNMKNNPTLSCLKSFGEITENMKISHHLQGGVCLVLLNEQTKNMVKSYDHINIRYSNKKRAILSNYGVQ